MKKSVKNEAIRVGDIEVFAVTADRWRDFEKLFGPRGACGGCWCMAWRLSRSEFEKNKGESNRRSMKRIIGKNKIPGILGYLRGEPVGWCSVCPREVYPALERSRVLARIDEKPVWSVTCLFIARGFRGKGVSVAMLKAAVEHVGRMGGKIVEGYPVEPTRGEMPAAFAWTGTARAFVRAGYAEAARRSRTRPIMRAVAGAKAKRRKKA
jgi:GNAT superfamily N-acetyltransferase